MCCHPTPAPSHRGEREFKAGHLPAARDHADSEGTPGQQLAEQPDLRALDSSIGEAESAGKADLYTLSHDGRLRSVTAVRSSSHLGPLHLPGSSSSCMYSAIVRSLAETADRSASAGSTIGASTGSALDVAVEGVRRDQDPYPGPVPATARQPGCSSPPGGRAAARACP